ncbi:MAG: hypothetical protein IJW43_01215 [Clostridia bacterium]|nr:hypothetical protein [Clostridia bacterium]
MKRKITSIVGFIMAVLMSMACVSGCRLITTNNDRDMDQVVATINLNEKEEKIYKRDMVMQYLNYGYTYVQSYGYTLEQTYELIFDGLITSRIMAQGAMKVFEEENKVLNASITDVNNPERYLDEEAVVDALYNTRHSISELIESMLEAEEEKYQDAYIGDVRAVPTNATNKAVELSLDEKKEYNKEKFDISSDAAHRDAFNDIVELLKVNSLLEDASTKFDGTLESTLYYKNTYKSNLEAELLTRLEEDRSLSVRSALTFEELENEYLEALEDQKNWNNADFVTALGSASVGSPMLYSSFGSYGYVYNLLLGATSEQTSAISAIKTENPNISNEDFAKERKEILKATLVKDLRSGWVISGFDAEMRGEDFIFTGDYTFAKDKANALAFQGKVNKIKDADAEKHQSALYTVTDTTVYELDAFIDFMNGYLGGTATDNTSAYASLGDSIYGAKNLEGVSEYTAKINDMLFAFSTDSGSLNTYKGYVIKPPVDGANTEEYVATFGEAGRILLEQGEGYVIVASDYGYHVMFYSEQFSIDYSVGSLVEYLNKEAGETKTRDQWIEYYNSMVEDWEEFANENNYLYNTANSLTTAKVNNALATVERELINANRYDVSDKVVLYKDRFQDLYK